MHKLDAIYFAHFLAQAISSCKLSLPLQKDKTRRSIYLIDALDVCTELDGVRVSNQIETTLEFKSNISSSLFPGAIKGAIVSSLANNRG